MSWVWRGLLAAAGLGVVGLVAAILAAPEPPAIRDPGADGPCARLQVRCRTCARDLRGEARHLAARLARSEDPELRRLARHLGPLLDGALAGEAIREQCERRLADPELEGLVRQASRCYQATDCPGFARCLRKVAESTFL